MWFPTFSSIDFAGRIRSSPVHRTRWQTGYSLPTSAMKSLELDYDILLPVVDSHESVITPVLSHYCSLHRMIRAVAWAGAVSAVYGFKTYTIACSAKWPVKTDEEVGADLLEGRPPSGYYGYCATPQELADAITERRLPEQLHYCVGVEGHQIVDPWGTEVMREYEEVAGKPWPESLALPRIIVGSERSLQMVHDYHYSLNIPVSSTVNHIVSSIARNIVRR